MEMNLLEKIKGMFGGKNNETTTTTAPTTTTTLPDPEEVVNELLDKMETPAIEETNTTTKPKKVSKPNN